ncbi:MAG: putative nitrogen fixation protein NifT [Fibrobacterota bacterium]
MKVMIRKLSSGTFTAYIPKKDLEEPIVQMDNAGLWGGNVTLANGWRLEMPVLDDQATFPRTVEARRLEGD